jgi:lysine/ornithine N-monooxygenase
MKMSSCEVAVIGAGPYGLAATAHLKSAGLETWTFGQTMDFWQKNMPTGMLLRSPWDASHIADPHRALTLNAYEKNRGVHLSRPVPLEDFVQYGQWFQRQVVPDLDTRRVQRIERGSAGFRLVISDNESIQARHVVIAAGIAPFARRPAVFGEISRTLVSHSSDHSDFKRFAGKQVVIIGGGQSAIESAALLDEAGANVELMMRSQFVRWLRRSALFHNRYNPFRRLLYHRTDVGPAIVSQIVSRPHLLRRLPASLQRKIAERSIRPAGAAWLVPRVRGVRITTGCTVVSATATDSRVRLALSDGSARSVDHVILGTGFSVDVSRYEFLGPLARSLSLVNGYPALGDGFESSVPGLHFIGAPAAWSFGPLMRFVSGTEFAGRTLMRALARGRVHQVSEDNSQWVALAKSQGQ